MKRIHAYVLERMCCLCCLATRVSADRANIFTVVLTLYVLRVFCDGFKEERTLEHATLVCSKRDENVEDNWIKQELSEKMVIVIISNNV